MSECLAAKVNSTRDHLAELEELVNSARYTVNLNPAWLARYLESFHCQKAAFLLEARDAHSGRLVGALPLETRGVPAGPGWTLRRLVPLGSGSSDFNQILCLQGNEAGVAASLCRWLVVHAGEWDSLRMEFVPQSSRAWRELVQAFHESGLYPKVLQRRFFYKVDTRGSWENYQKGFLAGHLDTLRNLRNRLTRERGEAEVVILQRGIEDHLEGFLACYRKRRQASGEEDPLDAQPERLPFLISVVGDFEQLGKARLSMLKSGGEVLAYQLDWVDRGIWYFYHPAFDDRYARYSPGRILLLETLKVAFEDPQIDEFNFMRGEDAYKAQFAPQTENYISLRVWNRRSLRLRATAYYSRLEGLLKPRAKSPRHSGEALEAEPGTAEEEAS